MLNGIQNMELVKICKNIMEDLEDEDEDDENENESIFFSV